jgi:hypothetical protein
MLAKAVIAASTLGIFDALEQGPLTAGEIASRCETDRDATEGSCGLSAGVSICTSALLLSYGHSID